MKNKNKEQKIIIYRERSLLENPTFLFVLLGVLTIGIMVGTYIVASYYQEPEVVIISIATEAALMVFIGGIIIKSVDRLALADEIKSEFISIASHQLRTPLSTINWSLDFLLKGKAGGVTTEQLEILTSMKQANQGMVKLVNDLLNVSRIEMGRIKFAPSVFSLAKLVRDITGEYKYFAEASNVVISLRVKGEIPDVYSDREYIKQAFTNILDNAIKYIKDKGRVDILISSHGSKAFIEIKDNGVGIPKEDQKRIFEKFFRSKNILGSQTSGSGIGLYITKAIIKGNGGDIGFISKEGRGTTFWFTLPIARKD